MSAPEAVVPEQQGLGVGELVIPDKCPPGVEPAQWDVFKAILPSLHGKPVQHVAGGLTLHVYYLAHMLDRVEDLDALQEWALRLMRSIAERRALLTMPVPAQGGH